MANINLLTPQAIYGKNVHFQIAGTTSAGGSMRTQIGSLVEAGKTRFVTSLVYSTPMQAGTIIGQVLRLYKKLANGSEVSIFNGVYASNTSNFEIINKSSGGIYLEENEALIIEAVTNYSSTEATTLIQGHMTYLEIA